MRLLHLSVARVGNAKGGNRLQLQFVGGLRAFYEGFNEFERPFANTVCHFSLWRGAVQCSAVRCAWRCGAKGEVRRMDADADANVDANADAGVGVGQRFWCQAMRYELQCKKVQCEKGRCSIWCRFVLQY